MSNNNNNIQDSKSSAATSYGDVVFNADAKQQPAAEPPILTSAKVEAVNADIQALVGAWGRYQEAVSAVDVGGDEPSRVENEDETLETFRAGLSLMQRRLEKAAAEAEKKAKKNASLMELPTNVVAHILTFCKINERGPMALSKTCKHFHDIVTLELLFKHCQFVFGCDCCERRQSQDCCHADPFFGTVGFYSECFDHAAAAMGRARLVDIITAKPYLECPNVLFSFIGSVGRDASEQQAEKLAKYVKGCWTHFDWSVRSLQWRSMANKFLYFYRPLYKKMLKYTLDRWGDEREPYPETKEAWLNELNNGVGSHCHKHCYKLLLNHSVFWNTLKAHCLSNENENELQGFKAAIAEDDRDRVLEMLDNSVSRLELYHSL